MVKNRNIIGILIILCVLLGIIFIGIDYNIDSESGHRNSHTLSNVKSLSNKVFYLVRENLKASEKTTQYRQKNLYESYSSHVNSLLRDFLSISKPIDYRKCIRQAIPHYFNGSNYKILPALFVILNM